MANEELSTSRLGWAALVFAVLCMSAGGVFFALMPSVPPFLKASWRLWATAMFQVLPCIFTIWSLQQDKSTRTSTLRRDGPSLTSSEILIRWCRCMPLLIVTGIILSIHFMAWSWSIDHTSLAHSLLFVSTHPVILVIGAWFIFVAERMLRSCPGKLSFLTSFDIRRPGALETLGAIIAVVGAGVMVMDISTQASDDDDDNHQPTIVGDIAATIGAAAMVFYLVVGSKVRAWMPIWMYAFPVTFVAAITASIFSWLLESTSPLGYLENGWFGWFDSARLGLLTVGAGGVSGILGHTLANYSLKHVSSLIVSITILAESLIGSVFGWLLGLQPNPGLFTWIGGIILLVGAAAVIYGQEQKQEDSPKPAAPELPKGRDHLIDLYSEAHY